MPTQRRLWQKGPPEGPRGPCRGAGGPHRRTCTKLACSECDRRITSLRVPSAGISVTRGSRAEREVNEKRGPADPAAVTEPKSRSSCQNIASERPAANPEEAQCALKAPLLGAPTPTGALVPLLLALAALTDKLTQAWFFSCLGRRAHLKSGRTACRKAAGDGWDALA